MAQNTTWTKDIDDVLHSIRLNSLRLCKRHKERYFANKYRIMWYRLPVIILNGANSIISVGLQPYADQGTISLTTSLIALTCGIIGSIELFLGVQKKLENDMISQRDYYLLSIDIHKTLSLKPRNRPIPAKDYLEKSYNTYTKLIESSETLLKKIDDKLIPIDIPFNISERDVDLDDDEIHVTTPNDSGSVHLNLPRNVNELSMTDD